MGNIEINIDINKGQGFAGVDGRASAERLGSQVVALSERRRRRDCWYCFWFRFRCAQKQKPEECSAEVQATTCTSCSCSYKEPTCSRVRFQFRFRCGAGEELIGAGREEVQCGVVGEVSEQSL